MLKRQEESEGAFYMLLQLQTTDLAGEVEKISSLASCFNDVSNLIRCLEGGCYEIEVYKLHFSSTTRTTFGNNQKVWYSTASEIQSKCCECYLQIHDLFFRRKVFR